MRLHREAEFLWDPRDLWIGVYWKRWTSAIEFYVCLLPCVPLRLYFQWYR